MKNEKIKEQRPYAIVTSMLLCHIVDAVNGLIERGYRPYGDLRQNEKGEYYQPMFKEKGE